MGSFVYVTQQLGNGDNQLLRLDPETLAVDSAIIDARPMRRMIVDGEGFAQVTADNYLLKIDIDAMSVVDSFFENGGNFQGQLDIGGDGLVYTEDGFSNVILGIDPISMTEAAQLTPTKNASSTIQAEPNDRLLVGNSGNSRVDRFDLQTQSFLASFDLREAPQDFAIADGFIYAALRDGNLLKLDPTDLSEVSVVDLGFRINSIALDSDGFLYTGGGDQVIWKINRSDFSIAAQFSGHTGFVSQVVFAPNGFLYSISDDKTIRKIDPSDMTEAAINQTVLEGPPKGLMAVIATPLTPQEKFNASHADASAADPKVTALIRPADVQRSIDTDVSNLAGGPNLYVVEAIFDIGELQNLNPYNPTTEKPRVFFVKDDQPGLREGKNLLLKGYTIRDADPSVPVTCTFWGP